MINTKTIDRRGWQYKCAAFFADLLPGNVSPSKSACVFFHQVWLGALIIFLICAIVLGLLGILFTGNVLLTSSYLGLVFGIDVMLFEGFVDVYLLFPVAVGVIVGGILEIKHTETWCFWDEWTDTLAKFNFDEQEAYKYFAQFKGYDLWDYSTNKPCDYNDYFLANCKPNNWAYYTTFPYVKYFMRVTLGLKVKTPVEVTERKVQTKQHGLLMTYVYAIKNKVCPTLEFK